MFKLKQKFRPNVTGAKAKPALRFVRHTIKKLPSAEDPSTNEVIVENESSNDANASCDNVPEVPLRSTHTDPSHYTSVPVSSALFARDSSDDDTWSSTSDQPQEIRGLMHYGNVIPVSSALFERDSNDDDTWPSTSHPSEVEHAVIHHEAKSTRHPSEVGNAIRHEAVPSTSHPSEVEHAVIHHEAKSTRHPSEVGNAIRHEAVPSTSHPSEVEHAVIHHEAKSLENEQEEEFIINYYDNPDSPEIIISHESSEVENSNEGNLPVPQLMVDSDGNVVIDEKSLYIPQTAREHPKEQQEKRKTRWNASDTEVFYRALRCVGLDFDTMERMLKKWSRRELKAKYKRELKQNPEGMEQALRDNCSVKIQFVESKKVLPKGKKKTAGKGVFIIS